MGGCKSVSTQPEVKNEEIKATVTSNESMRSSVQLRNAPPSEQTNIRMIQNVLLVWLDQNIDEQKAVAQLRHVVNSIHQYTNGEECIQFLETMNKENVCMIISDALAQEIVPQIHGMSQVHSILILCSNQQYHEEWVKQWSKIKGVFTEINVICEALKQTARQCEQDSMPISVIDKNSDRLEATFMYTTILKEILLNIQFKDTHFQTFVTYCRDILVRNQNEDELINLDKFESHYDDHTPICWYTQECFLYHMLNRALRDMNTGMIIKLGFFINDLHRQIGQLHKEQFGDHKSGDIFTVYRGQGMKKEQFKKMSEPKGGLIAFNNFLSTSKNRDVALCFAPGPPTDSEMVSILFVMKINPAQSTTPFASITHVSANCIEDEVLFSMQTVFRISEITSIGKYNRWFQMELTLTSDKDEDLCKLTDRIQIETHRSVEQSYRLGLLLLRLGEYETPQQIFELLCEQATDEEQKAHLYGQLGLAKFNEGKYEEALEFYQKTLEIYETSSSIDLNLASSYCNIGSIHYKKGDYPEALSFYKKALEIQQQFLPPNLTDLSMSYNNIGIACRKTGDYESALASYEKALEIQHELLPSYHPDLGMSYNNLGLVNLEMGDYPKALSSFEKALEIQQRALPPNHPNLAKSYIAHSNAYDKMGEHSKAIEYWEKALEIQKESLAPDHPDLATSYEEIARMYDNMGDYSKASSYYERAVDLGEQSLTSNHPILERRRKNLENIRQKL